MNVSASPSGSEKPTLASNGVCAALSKPVCAANAVTITGASSTSRNKRSATNATALPPSASSAVTPGRLNSVSVALRFSSLTSKPSVMLEPSNAFKRPSPSVSVKSLDTSVEGVRPNPASSVSFRPSLSESVSRKSGVSSGVSAPASVFTGVRPMLLAAVDVTDVSASKLSSRPSPSTSTKSAVSPTPDGAI